MKTEHIIIYCQNCKEYNKITNDRYVNNKYVLTCKHCGIKEEVKNINPRRVKTKGLLAETRWKVFLVQVKRFSELSKKEVLEIASQEDYTYCLAKLSCINNALKRYSEL